MDLRQRSELEYINRINRAIDYIYSHLPEKLTLEDVARVACFSPFHFHRIFSAMVDETLTDFIRRLRLERAALLLRHNPVLPIGEVAVQAGFSSQAVLARLFKERFGVTPTEWRQQGLGGEGDPERKDRQMDSKDRQAGVFARFYASPRRNEPPTAGGRSRSVKVEIRDMPQFHIAYVRHIGPYAPEPIEAAWETLCRWAGPRGLFTPVPLFLGISYDDPQITAPDRCRYDACITVPLETRGEGPVTIGDLPACRCAVTHYSGPAEGIKAAWNALYRDWLPQNGYQPTEVPCFEVYLEDPKTAGKFVMDLCLPVKPL